jgi:hypothetical protein
MKPTVRVLFYGPDGCNSIVTTGREIDKSRKMPSARKPNTNPRYSEHPRLHGLVHVHLVNM